MTDLSLDIFAELEAEISASLSKTSRKDEAARLVKKGNNRFLPHEARMAARNEAKALLDQIAVESWHSVSAVALFSEQACDGCGSRHTIFIQYMERQVHLHSRATRRLVRVSGPSPLLPRETLLQQTSTHICPDCSAEHGFSLPAAGDFTRHSIFTPPVNYNQEDLNHGPSEED